MRRALRVVHVLGMLSPAGRSGRVICALIMLVMGMGRLGMWPLNAALADHLDLTTYGTLLIGCAVGLLVTIPWRLRTGGRVIAAMGAILLAGIIWDVKEINVTMLVIAILTLALATECMTSRDDES